VLVHRPRRLRRTAAIRNLIRETNLSRHDFVLPLFVSEKIERAKEIPSMPGVHQYGENEIASIAQRAHESGVQAVLLFGIPKSKDEQASGAYAENGVVQNAVRQIKKAARRI
jgi:porphobilinogen synthase